MSYNHLSKSEWLPDRAGWIYKYEITVNGNKEKYIFANYILILIIVKMTNLLCKND